MLDPDLGAFDRCMEERRCGDALHADTDIKGAPTLFINGRPVVASHCNAWDVCPNPRNLCNRATMAIARTAA